MLAAFSIVFRDPLLRLVTLALFLTAVAVSSVMPYASLVAVELLGLTDAAYSAVLTASSAVMVIASVVRYIYASFTPCPTTAILPRPAAGCSAPRCSSAPRPRRPFCRHCRRFSASSLLKNVFFNERPGAAWH